MAIVHYGGNSRLRHPAAETGAGGPAYEEEEGQNAGLEGSGAPTVPPCSPDCSALFDALSKAQGQIKDPLKDADNPYFQSKYVTLAAVRDAVQGPLSANNLCVTQLSWVSNGREYIITRLGHKSGQFVESWIPVEIGRGPSNMQARGSAITYARRYALMAMLGVAPDDDDGEASMQRPAPAAARSAPPEPLKSRKVAAKDRVSDETYKNLVALAKAGVEGLSDVDADKFLLWSFNGKFYRDKPAETWDHVQAKHAASVTMAFNDKNTVASAYKKWKAQVQ